MENECDMSDYMVDINEEYMPDIDIESGIDCMLGENND